MHNQAVAEEQQPKTIVDENATKDGNDTKDNDYLREQATKFNELATNLKTAQSEERTRILQQMSEHITRFAEENGYPKPTYLIY